MSTVVRTGTAETQDGALLRWRAASQVPALASASLTAWLLSPDSMRLMTASDVASGSASLPATPSVHDWLGTSALSKSA